MLTRTRLTMAAPWGAMFLIASAVSLSEGGESDVPAAARPDKKAASSERSEPQWGSLAGRFVFEGALPQAREAETEAGARGKHKIRDESLVIDPNGRGIKNVVVFARKVSRIHEGQAELRKEGVTLDQRESRFQPHVLALMVGQPLRIKNANKIVHICLIRPRLGMQSNTEVNAMLSPGDEVEYRFSYAERRPLPVTCSFHPWMKAYVLPRDDAYFAVTDESGAFEIENLPAGENVEFQVWHERAADGALEAQPDWKNGRFRVTVPANEIFHLGDIVVPASAFDLRNGSNPSGD